MVGVGRPDEAVGHDAQGVLGLLEAGDHLVDEGLRLDAPLARPSRAMLTECSSVPVRKRVSWPCMRCQRAMTSAPMTSYSVCRPGRLFAYGIEVVR